MSKERLELAAVLAATALIVVVAAWLIWSQLWSKRRIPERIEQPPVDRVDLVAVRRPRAESWTWPARHDAPGIAGPEPVRLAFRRYLSAGDPYRESG